MSLRLSIMYFVLVACDVILIYIYQTDVQHALRTYMHWNQMETQFTASIVHKMLPRSLDDMLVKEPQPIPGRSIFFLETSRFLILQLTARQACAIESAAIHNPNLQVFVLFSRNTYRHNGNHSNDQRYGTLIDAILSYKNVQLRQLNLWQYVAGSPIEDWLKEGHLFRSSYPTNHMSDMLRLLSLYRYGGIYLDMDVVVLRSLEDVPLNFAGVESYAAVANGVMSMASTGFGHKIAESCLRDFQQNYNGKDWSNNGPGVITRVAKRICNTTNIAQLVENRKRCQGFNVFNYKAFYAVHSKNWQYFFQPQYLEQTMSLTNGSYLVHVWNKLSHSLSIKVNSETAYGKLAEKHCPRSYAAAGEFF